MDMKLLDHSILVTLAGSHAYGLNTDQSDVDVRGVYIPDLSEREDLFKTVEQINGDASLYNQFGCMINPNNPEFDSVMYSLRKFIKLASDVNPNIIEILYTADKDILYKMDPYYTLLRENRDIFLSQKAAVTFTGYASSQVVKIKRHKKWLDNPPDHCPTREEFNLPDNSRLQGVLQGLVQTRISDWNLDGFGLDTTQQMILRNQVFDLINGIVDVPVIDYTNWLQRIQECFPAELQKVAQLSDEMVSILVAENGYREAKRNWDHYEKWKSGRNAKRAELESKLGFDSKHAMHLIRLLRMCVEILTGKGVIVRRHDAKDFIGIRNGEWSYDDIMKYATKLRTRIGNCMHLTFVPEKVDLNRINQVYLQLIDEWKDIDG